MRRFLQAFLVLVSIGVVGCSTTHGTTRPPDAGDAWVPPSIRDGGFIGFGDTTIVQEGDAIVAGPGCRRDSECGAGQVCLRGSCQADPCSASGTFSCGDPAIAACRALCVPLRPLCDGVVCGNNQTCFDGVCVDGCFATSLCLSTCGPGSYCAELAGIGFCLQVRPCDAICGAGFACTYTCVPPVVGNPCDSVSCASGQHCVNGACTRDPCFGVSCAAGSYCTNGTCFNTCDCHGVDCGARGRCVLGRCQCRASCDGARCGDANGCGGECVGTCDAGFQCAGSGRVLPNGQADLECRCTPRCDNANCGDSDGCGGVCYGRCADGSGCMAVSSTDGHITRASCQCQESCPASSYAQACGTHMTVASRCHPGTNMTCSGTHCAPGLQCDGAACRCACPSPDSVACGTPIPGCGGTCGVGRRVPTGSTCNNGVLCTPTPCPSTLACGTNMPDGCGGSCRGSTCPTAQRCDGNRCVCSPSCFGTRCGDSDGCGGTCSGACASGQTCLPSGSGFACSGVADPTCGPPRVQCGGVCCTLGQQCVAGQCQIP